MQDGTDERPTSVASGINGRPSWDFDGDDDLLEMDSPPHSGTDGTFSLQIYPHDVSSEQVFKAFSSTSVTNEYLILGIDAAGKLFVEVNDGGSIDRVTGSTVLTINTPYTVIVNSDGDDWIISLDGVDETLVETTGSNSGKWVGDLSIDNMTLGALKHTSATKYYDGLMAELIDYEPVLSASCETRLDNYYDNWY